MQKKFTLLTAVAASLLLTIAGILVVAYTIAVGSDLWLFPSVETLGRDYLDRIIGRDLGGIAKLAYDSESSGCVKHAALRSIELYGGATVRNVRVTSEPGKGSDDRIEWTIVKFDYRQPHHQSWQTGEVLLMTNNRYNRTMRRSLHCVGG